MIRTALVLLVTIGLSLACASTGAAPGAKPAAATVAVTVTREGFTPARLTVKKGAPVTFVFTRRTEATCARDVVFPTTRTTTVKKDLPLGTPVELTGTYAEPGELEFTCGHGHIRGTIVVE